MVSLILGLNCSKIKGCDNDPPVVSNYHNQLTQNPVQYANARSNNRDIPSTSTENEWIIEHPSTDNENGENGHDSNGGNDAEQNYYVDEDGDNEDNMIVETAIVGEDEESLEEQEIVEPVSEEDEAVEENQESE